MVAVAKMRKPDKDAALPPEIEAALTPERMLAIVDQLKELKARRNIAADFGLGIWGDNAIAKTIAWARAAGHLPQPREIGDRLSDKDKEAIRDLKNTLHPDPRESAKGRRITAKEVAIKFNISEPYVFHLWRNAAFGELSKSARWPMELLLAIVQGKCNSTDLATRTGMTRIQITKAIAALRRLGLDIVPRGGGPQSYYVCRNLQWTGPIPDQIAAPADDQDDDQEDEDEEDLEGAEVAVLPPGTPAPVPAPEPRPAVAAAPAVEVAAPVPAPPDTLGDALSAALGLPEPAAPVAAAPAVEVAAPAPATPPTPPLRGRLGLRLAQAPVL